LICSSPGRKQVKNVTANLTPLGGRIANNIFKDISENISVKFGDLGCSSSGEDNINASANERPDQSS
jgi:hypothetical protein